MCNLLTCCIQDVDHEGDVGRDVGSLDGLCKGLLLFAAAVKGAKPPPLVLAGARTLEQPRQWCWQEQQGQHLQVGQEKGALQEEEDRVPLAQVEHDQQ